MMSPNCGAGGDLVFIQSIMMLFEVSVWCLWTVVLEKTLEIPLNNKEIEAVNPKGNQPWTFTKRTDTESEAPILWPPDAKNWLIGKDLDAGKDWRQEVKGMMEDEKIGWQHQLNGHEYEQTPGDGAGQGRLACCSPWGLKESDTTDQMNNIIQEDAQSPYSKEFTFITKG